MTRVLAGVARLVIALMALPSSARAGIADEAPPVREQRAALKRLEAELIIEPARREMAERRVHLRAARRGGSPHGTRLAPTPPSAPGVQRRAVPLAAPRNPGALATNVRVNSPPAFWTQSEVGIAAIGDTLVAAWNDGVQPGTTGPMSFSYSTDGGATWRPGAPFPIGNGLLRWESDPVLVADPRRGEFWFTALAIANQPPANAIGVLRGTVTDSGLVWGAIQLPRAPRDTLPDKPWLAVDSLTGRAAVSYTSFIRFGTRLRDQIEFQRSDDGGATWSPPLKLSSDAEEGLVQGSRPAFGPDGELHVVWSSVDTTDAAAGLDFIRLRTSRDGGAHFSAAANVAGVISNFASGAPGYNRPHAINFPSIAVDRGSGPYRGRIYVSWTESLNFFSQQLLPRMWVNEDRGSGPSSTPFVIGDVLRGTRSAGEPADMYRFSAGRGQTAMFYLDSLAGRLDIALGVGCGENPFELVYSDPPAFGRPRVAIATFPRDGEFTLTVQSGSGAGAYRVRTGWVTPGRAGGRDVRDVFVAHSDDGVRWSVPARVSDAPPWYDDWLPEAAVAPDGRAYVAWYDWRETPATGCSALSNVSLSRSSDGGDSWQWLGLLSDRPSDWATSSSNLVPNQGDYIGLFAGARWVFAGWADARNESPDVYFARLDSEFEPPGRAPVPRVSLAALRPNPAPGDVTLSVAITPGLPARLELWDISGRRLQEQPVETVGAGPGDVRFTPRLGLRSGLYLLRIVQGTASATARLAIVR